MNGRRRLDVLASMWCGGYRRPFADRLRPRGVVLGRHRLFTRLCSSSRPLGGSLHYPVDRRQAKQCVSREPNPAAHSAEIDTGNRRSRQMDALPEIADGRVPITQSLGCPAEVVKRQIVLVPDVLDEGSEIRPSCGAKKPRRLRLRLSPRRKAGFPARPKRLAGLQFGDCLLRAESGAVFGATYHRPTAKGDQRDAH
jgi:hypothetical protein